MAKTVTPADLEKQVENMKAQIAAARQQLAERLEKRNVLAAEVEKANHELGLYVLSHQAINGQAPSALEAEKNYHYNETAIGVLEKQIGEMAATAADLEQARLDAREAAILEKDADLKAKRRATQQGLRDAQNADLEIALQQESIPGALYNCQLDAGQFRNAGGRAQFMRTLTGELEHA